MRICIFDTETTGLPSREITPPMPNNIHLWPHIVQFSYIIYDTDKDDSSKPSKIVTLKDYIIQMKPGIIIPEVTSNIHGITNEISQVNGVDIELVLEEFITHIEDVDLIVAHNYQFDKNMTCAEILRLPGDTSIELKKKHHSFEVMRNMSRYYCTCEKSRTTCKIKAINKSGKEYTKSPSQTELCEFFFGFRPLDMHNSLNDITICLLNFHKLYFDRDIRKESTKLNDMISKLIPDQYPKV